MNPFIADARYHMKPPTACPCFLANLNFVFSFPCTAVLCFPPCFILSLASQFFFGQCKDSEVHVVSENCLKLSHYNVYKSMHVSVV